MKKALYSTLMLACIAMMTPAQAQTSESTSKPRAVLFKLHDIKPAMDTEGVITHCDFMATFYNRTEDSLRQARLELGWTDSVTEKYKIGEEEKEEPNTTRSYSNSRSRDKVLGEILTTVDMPALGSYKQVSVKGSVKTEKCFLLLDNLDFRVENCSLVSKNVENNDTKNYKSKASREALSGCASLFEYIDSKNPEYYDEFKAVSYSEQERLINDDRKKDVSDLENTYNEVVEKLKQAEDTINKIK